MGRRPINVDDIKIEQKAPIIGDTALKDRDGDVVLAERGAIDSKYARELSFNEEPVTIQLEPSAEKNAATAFPVWVNGKGCEVRNGSGKWFEMPYLPVGVPLTIKRKYLEVIIRAKIDTVHTEVKDKDGEHPNNVVNRFTSAVHSFSIIEDKNPVGGAWLAELRRRNM